MNKYRIIFNTGRSIQVFANNMDNAKNEAKRIYKSGHNPLHSFIKSIYKVMSMDRTEMAMDRMNG